MGLKRVMWVRRYQGQCRALRPLGHQGYRLRSYNKDQPLCSGYSVAPRVVANPWGAVPVSTLARLAGLVLAGLRAISSLSGRFFCSSLVGARLCQPPYGRLVLRGVDCAAARADVAGCCLCCLLSLF